MLLDVCGTTASAQGRSKVAGTYFNSGFNSLGILHLHPDFSYVDSSLVGKTTGNHSTCYIVNGRYELEENYSGTYVRLYPVRIERVTMTGDSLAGKAMISVREEGQGKSYIRQRFLAGRIGGHDVLLSMDTAYTYKKLSLFMVAVNYYNQFQEFVHGWYVKDLTIDSLNTMTRQTIPRLRPTFDSPFDSYFLTTPVEAMITSVFPDRTGSGETQNYLINKGSDDGLYEGMEFLAAFRTENRLTVIVCNPHSAILNGRVNKTLKKGSRLSTRESSASVKQ